MRRSLNKGRERWTGNSWNSKEERNDAVPTVTPAAGRTGTAGLACGGPEPQLESPDLNPKPRGVTGYSQAQEAALVRRLCS